MARNILTAAGNSFSVDGASLSFRKEWTPAEITTEGWWDPSDESTITDSGGSVSQIDDKSGNGYDLVQGLGSAQPTTGVRTQNSLNVLDFDGGDHMDASGVSTPSSGDISFFMVAVHDSIATTATGLFSAEAVGLDFQFDSNDSTDFNGEITHAGLGPTNSPCSGGPFNGPSIYNVTFDFATAGTMNVYIDGTVRTVGHAYDAKMNSTVQIVMGANRAGTVEINGGVGEFIICEDVTQATREIIEGYLAHKWGLTANLPANHPYKYTAPVAGETKNPLWTPSEVTSLGWWDAADDSTITESGGAVSQIDDKSGRGKHLVQATGAEQPITDSRTLNGRNVLDFDGTDDFLRNDSWDIGSSGDVSFFLVAGIDAVVAIQDSLFSMPDATEEFDARSNSATQWDGRLFCPDTNVTITNAGGPFAGPSIYNYEANLATTDHRFLVDGTQIGIGSGGYTVAWPGTTLFLFRAVVNFEMDGLVAEFIVTEDVTEATRQRIEGYLAWKWGLVGRLPVTHPYKYDPPTV